ncbi:MAG TPA: hypothetical protein VFN26_15725 [Candidatus Acidoferrum sp.]|nr:hypothetical protein [Candidatus Acidoferrum sp.]
MVCSIFEKYNAQSQPPSAFSQHSTGESSPQIAFEATAGSPRTTEQLFAGYNTSQRALLSESEGDSDTKSKALGPQQAQVSSVLA